MKLHYILTSSMLALFILAGSLPLRASEPPILVLNQYREVPGKGDQLSDFIVSRIMKQLAEVQGLKWMKFYRDPATGLRGSIMIWENESAWTAYRSSDLRKSLVGQVRPLIKGDVSSKSFRVVEN